MEEDAAAYRKQNSYVNTPEPQSEQDKEGVDGCVEEQEKFIQSDKKIPKYHEDGSFIESDLSGSAASQSQQDDVDKDQ